MPAYNRQLKDKDGNLIYPVVNIATMIDIFYPVGSYYETSDPDFDPNVSWTGTWVEDTTGKVLVAQDSGTFSTVGNTGGSETNTHYHWTEVSFDGSSAFIGKTVGANTRVITGNRATLSLTGSGTAATREDATYNETINILQPYIVIKRWHRTA